MFINLFNASGTVVSLAVTLRWAMMINLVKYICIINRVINKGLAERVIKEKKMIDLNLIAIFFKPRYLIVNSYNDKNET